MNYELLKELKDAGFSQGVKKGEVEYKPEHGLLHKPTLSELIEACGMTLLGLTRGIEDDKHIWIASSGIGLNDVTGSTPEEAVARLYLALNKK